MRAYFGLEKKKEEKIVATATSPPVEGARSPSSRSRVDSGGIFSSFFGRSASFAESPDGSISRIGDVVSQWLNSASSTLSSSIEEVLSDSAALSGDNMDGFKRLLVILENEDYEIHTKEANRAATAVSEESFGKTSSGEVSLDTDAVSTEDDIDRGERHGGGVHPDPPREYIPSTLFGDL